MYLRLLMFKMAHIFEIRAKLSINVLKYLEYTINLSNFISYLKKLTYYEESSYCN